MAARKGRERPGRHAELKAAVAEFRARIEALRDDEDELDRNTERCA